MDYENIIYTKERDTGIATITMNRPVPLNAYTQVTVEEMLAAIDDVRKDDAIQVLVLTGTGRGFSVGADIIIDREIPTRPPPTPRRPCHRRHHGTARGHSPPGLELVAAGQDHHRRYQRHDGLWRADAGLGL